MHTQKQIEKLQLGGFSVYSLQMKSKEHIMDMPYESVPRHYVFSFFTCHISFTSKDISVGNTEVSV